MNKVFAVGLGFKETDFVCYEKVFIHTEQNDGPVMDFLRIVTEEFNYQGGNVTINLVGGKNYTSLERKFTESNHNGSVNFLRRLEDCCSTKVGFICIMATNEPPVNKEEAYLVLKLFSDGTLNALNPQHRNPLTKVFAGLPTIEMSIAGIPGKKGCHDKFPSWTIFNDFGTNRFAPTSFVRQGAHLGNGNTLMFGATVNFGVSIGDDNLLDGHCSIASCVQIGHRNKIGSFVSMEGVLSPVNENPVVIGSDNFFGTRCRVGTGIIIGDKNFWGSGVDISRGTPLRDFRNNSPTYGSYVKAGSDKGIQAENETMIVVNNSRRFISKIYEVYPGEYLLYTNTEDNQSRFARNDDLNSNN